MTTKRHHPDEHSWQHELMGLGEETDMDEEDEGGGKRLRPAWLLRLAAAIALVAFVALSYAWLPLISPSHFKFLSQDQELSSESLVKSSKPAVVSIMAIAADGLPGSSRAGTGFNIDPSGLVVTNRHVVDGASSIEITFSNEQRFISKDCQIIPGYDLALVRIKGHKLPILPVSDKLPTPGEEVTIIGNPLGFKRISARGSLEGYYAGGEDGSTVFAITAIAEPGSSGSPVLNKQGAVVGIVYAITNLKEDGHEVRYSLAIPAVIMKTYIKDSL